MKPLKLRPYQQMAMRQTFGALESHGSALVVMATGLGKTVFFSAMAAQWPGGRVLIIAHREELITQATGKLACFLGDDVSVEMADNYSDERSFARSRAVVASVQTLSQKRRLDRFRPMDFGLVIIDEAHHAVANSYHRVITHFQDNPNLRLLGVTATPRRADELAMGQVFQSVAFDYGIEPAIEDGWLVPVTQRAVRVDGLDFSRVRTTAGDLNEHDLEEILTAESPLHQVVRPLIEMAGDQPTLVFGVTVKHAALLAEVIDRYKPRSAVALSGKTDKDERRRVVEQFKCGGVQFLCNCGLFLEGFDAPNTSVVAMARPTKSLPLYIQVLGRGTRPLPGVVDGVETAEDRRDAISTSSKPNMLVLDFVGNSGRHKIVTAQDVLGGKYGEPVRRYAQKTAEEEGRPVGVEESLERASDEMALEEEIREREKRRKIIADRAQYQAENVSPFAGGRRWGGVNLDQPVDPPTDKQVWFLIRRLNWTEDAANRLTKRQASAIIGKAKGA